MASHLFGSAAEHFARAGEVEAEVEARLQRALTEEVRGHGSRGVELSLDAANGALEHLSGEAAVHSLGVAQAIAEEHNLPYEWVDWYQRAATGFASRGDLHSAAEVYEAMANLHEAQGSSEVADLLRNLAAEYRRRLGG